eukprot:UN25185
MHYSRQSSDPNEIRYATSTAVTLAEFFKMCVGIIYVMFNSTGNPVSTLYESTCSNFADLMKMSVPATCYMIQNNLLFVALSNLDSALYQVVYQLKIFTTAIFSVTMLGRQLTGRQWFALALLMVGAALANISTTTPPKESDHLPDRNTTLGLVACLSATVSSGFSGVWFEKVLKHTKPTLWVRNIQLGLFGCLSGLLMCYFKDWDHILEHGFFGGYKSSTYGVIFLNTVG